MTTQNNHHRLCVAPMLDWTNRHCRYFHRLLSSHIRTYSEMVTTPAILRGQRHKYLAFSQAERPVALQLGGSDPKALAECAKIAEDYGYDEVNLNVGCPSDRVQQGTFGACLMKQPQRVAECVYAMQQAVNIPITVKSRIGVDDQDSYPQFAQFIQTVKQAGCQIFIVHARKALLQGLSPKQNREIPPLKPDYAYRIKQQNPDLTIIINGGISGPEQAGQHWQKTDGVMIGRAFWNNPWLIYQMHQAAQLPKFTTTREQALTAYQQYCAEQIQQGQKMSWLIRPILGLYHGHAGNKKYKSQLVQQAAKHPQDHTIIAEAQQFIDN